MVDSGEKSAANLSALCAECPVGHQDAVLMAQRELEAHIRHQRTLAELGRLALRGGALQTLLQEVASRVAGALDAELSVLSQLSDDGAFLLPLAGTGWGEAVLGAARPNGLDETLAAHALGLGAPLVVTELAADPRAAQARHLHEQGVRSAIVVEISGQLRPFGLMGVYWKRPRTFSVDEVEFVRAAADLAAVALDKHRVEHERNESRARLATVLQSVPDAVGAVALDGTVLLANPNMARMIGKPTPADVEGRHIKELLPPSSAATMMAFIAAQVQQVSPSLIEHHSELQPGRVLETKASALQLDGRPALLFIVRDVSDRKQMESRLSLSDRMASVGTLAAGMAHELNNPLAFVTSNLRFIADELRELTPALSDPSKAAPDRAERAAELCLAVDDAVAGAERMRVIVRDMKHFSRADEQTRKRVDLVQVADSAIQMTRAEIKLRAQVVKRFGPAPLVWANEPRLGQVLVNLLVNAAQSIPEGDVSRNTILVEVGTAENGWPQVRVRDTGVGIPGDVLPRVFDPFFTTKPVGIGTGLGLSVCHAIVTAEGGTIEVQSAVGRGTTVTVTLPACQGLGEPASAQVPEQAPARRGRILIIDDEPMLLASFKRLLDRDHEVTAELSPRSALSRLRADDRFDVVFCDVMMPDLTAMEFHASLERELPNLLPRVVYMTGGAFTETARDFLAGIQNACLEKPFDAAHVRALIAARIPRVQA